MESFSLDPPNCSGALAIDEAVNLAQSVASGNANTVSFWLLPQWHSSSAKAATLKHRRLLEDKVIGCLALDMLPSISSNPGPPFGNFQRTILGDLSWIHSISLTIQLTQRGLDTYEIAVNFTDAQHQGDRRKKSQQCSLAPFRTVWFNLESKKDQITFWFKQSWYILITLPIFQA